MELEIQKFLRTKGIGLKHLEDKYGIIYKWSKDYPNLLLLKYDQLKSSMGERIVQECRGIILDGNDNWSVVARPYDKFFNYGEGHSASVDWNSAKVYDKLDGSLMTLYWYDGWRVSSSGNPDASGDIWSTLGCTLSFKSMFWQVFSELGYQLPFTAEETNLCFMFELMTPYNKIVVQHKEPRLVLHGVRNVKTGEELNIDAFGIYGWEICKTFNLNSIEEVIKSADKLNPIQNEGYIVVDKNFNRIKVKSPAYVALHHLRDSMSPRRMLEIVRTNESSEFLNYFPEYKELYIDTQYKYMALITSIQRKINDLLADYGANPKRKDIGLATKGLFWQGMAFPVIYDNKTVEECLASMSIRKLEFWLVELC